MPANSNDVLVRFMADTSNLMSGIAKADGALANASNSMAESVNHMSGVMKTASVVIGTAFGVAITNSTSQAIQFEALMDNISKTMGNSANDFVAWQETVGRSLGFSKLEGAKMAQNLSTNLRMISKDQEDLYKKTTALMKASAVIRSNTGMSQTEISDRIRSAMNQEADGAMELGIDVRTSAIMMSDAYRTMANGQPWADLTGNMQKAILYQYILETTTKNYGNEIANNTSVQLAVFKASLQDMSLALGQAFTPIVSRVLPYLSALVSWITKALGYVRVFMETLFGYKHKATQSKEIENTTKATKGLGQAMSDNAKQREKDAEAIKKQKKENQGFLASFDEVHTIAKKVDTPSGGGGGGGSTGGGGDTGGISTPFPDMEKDTGGFIEKLSEAQKKVMEFAEKVKDFLKPIIEVIKEMGGAVKEYLMEKIADLGNWWEKNGDQIQQAMKNVWTVIKPILEWVVKFIWDNLKHAIDGLIEMFKGVVEFFTGIFTGDLKMVWEGVKKIFLGALEAIWGIINLLFIGDIMLLLRGGFTAIVKIFTELGPTIGSLWTKMWTFMKGEVTMLWQGIKEAISKKLGEILTKMQETSPHLWDALAKPFKNVAKWFYDNLVVPISERFTLIRDGIKNKAEDSWAYLIKPFKSASTWFYENLVTPISTRMSSIRDIIKGKAEDAWAYLKKPFSTVSTWFETNVVNKITKAFKNITGSISQNGIVNAVKSVMNSVIGYLNNFIKLFNKVKNKIPFMDSSSNIPTIPKLYRGGITNGKTIAQIGDNVGGREVVSPLDQLQGIIANTMMSTLSMKGGGGGGGNVGGDIIMNIDGREFARIIKPFQNIEQNRVGQNVRLNNI